MKYATGWKKQPTDERDLCYPKAQPHYQFPSSIDLRKSGYMPPIWDQGALGSCTSFGIARCLAYELNKLGEVYFEPSHLFIYYNERMIEGTISQDAGANIRDGIKSCNVYGFCAEFDWPYDISKFTEKPPQKAYADALQNEIHYYAAVENTDVNNIKLALSHGNPVVFGIELHEDFESYTGGVIKNNGGQIIGGHCMDICGYDDSKNAFLVPNSWGTSWGESGYCWIDYAYMTSELVSDLWVIRLR